MKIDLFKYASWKYLVDSVHCTAVMSHGVKTVTFSISFSFLQPWSQKAFHLQICTSSTIRISTIVHCWALVYTVSTVYYIYIIISCNYLIKYLITKWRWKLYTGHIRFCFCHLSSPLPRVKLGIRKTVFNSNSMLTQTFPPGHSPFLAKRR